MLYLWISHKLIASDMIILFTTGNILSFKEQSTLSLATSALKDIQVTMNHNVLHYFKLLIQKYLVVIIIWKKNS